MLDAVGALLERSPLLALFAAIGIGYAVGRISVAGFSLDIGAVLFAGLALGAIAPDAAPPALVSSIGLVMFLYGIGIQYGRQFFAGLAGAGLKWNALGVAGVFGALAVALIAGGMFGRVSRAYPGTVRRVADQYAGAAGCDRCGRRSHARNRVLRGLPGRDHRPDSQHLVFSRLVRARLAQAPAAARYRRDRACRQPAGAKVAEVTAGLPAGVHLVAVRQGRTNKLPDPQIQLDAGDGLLLFGEPGAIEQARNSSVASKSGRSSPAIAARWTSAGSSSRGPR